MKLEKEWRWVFSVFVLSCVYVQPYLKSIENESVTAAQLRLNFFTIGIKAEQLKTDFYCCLSVLTRIEDHYALA